MTDTRRTLAQRKAHVLHLLETGRDVMVATAGEGGVPHLVPFSLGWDGQQVIAATVADSVTVHNIQASGRVRLSVGDMRDVVLIDGSAQLQGAQVVDTAIAELFAARNGWDPRTLSANWLYLLIQPERIQAWHNEDELNGRTLMKQGRWLDSAQ